MLTETSQGHCLKQDRHQMSGSLLGTQLSDSCHMLGNLSQAAGYFCALSVFLP